MLFIYKCISICYKTNALRRLIFKSPLSGDQQNDTAFNQDQKASLGKANTQDTKFKFCLLFLFFSFEADFDNRGSTHFWCFWCYLSTPRSFAVIKATNILVVGLWVSSKTSLCRCWWQEKEEKKTNFSCVHIALKDSLLLLWCFYVFEVRALLFRPLSGKRFGIGQDV